MNASSFIAAALVLAGLCGHAAGSDSESDRRLAAGLLGTWQIPESRSSTAIRGEATYSSDGAVAGFVILPDHEAPGREVTVRIRARWKVEGGVVHLDDFETEPKSLMPPGHTQRYKVLSLTPVEVVFRDLDRGVELYRRRRQSF